MPIETKLVNPKDGKLVSVSHNHDTNITEQGLHVLTEELVKARPGGRPFFNSAYGVNMNQNAAAGGTPVNVHDGIDNTYWTGSNIVGSTAVFDAVGAGQTTKGITWTGPSLNDTMQFAKGSDIDLSAYATLDIAVYVDRRWTTDEVQLYWFDTGLAIEASDRINLTDYINELDYDVWQSASIPLTAFGVTLATTDALRIQYTNRVSNSIEVRFDDIIIQETGEPIEYKVLVPQDVKFHMYGIRALFVDGGSIALVNNAAPNMSYDKFFSLSGLGIGITFKWVRNGETIFARQVRDNHDMLNTGFTVTQAFDDSTNTVMAFRVDFSTPIYLPGDSDDYNYVSLTVNDNLSALTKFSCTARGTTEIDE